MHSQNEKIKAENCADLAELAIGLEKNLSEIQNTANTKIRLPSK